MAGLAWLLGLALQLQQPQLWPWAAYGGCAAAAVLALLAWQGLKRHVHTAGPWVLRSATWPAWAALGWAALGWAALGWAALGWATAGLQASAHPPAIDARLEGRDLDVVGRVSAMVQVQERGWRFRFTVEQAQLQGEPVVLPRQLLLGWYAASSGQDAGPPVELMRPGERWRLRVRLKAAHGHINPGGFDYELWLWEQGIRATGYVRQGPHDPPPERLAQTGRHPLEWWRQQVRERLLLRLNASGPDPGAEAGSQAVVAGVLAALVTGDQAAIERGAWEVFRATGVAHLMSISGLHVTMLGWLASRLLAVLWRRSALWGRR